MLGFECKRTVEQELARATRRRPSTDRPQQQRSSSRRSRHAARTQRDREQQAHQKKRAELVRTLLCSC